MTTTTARGLGKLEQAWIQMDAIAPVTFSGTLHLEHGPSPETLGKALAQLQASQPLLNVSIAKGRFLHHDPSAPIPLTCAPRKHDEQWRDVMEAELTRPFQTDIAPLARFIYLKDDYRSDLVFSFHHTIVDSRSGEVFLNQLLATCAEIEAGADPAPATPHAILPALDQLFPRGFQGLAKARKMAGFMARQMKAEIAYRRGLANRQQIHARQPTRCRVISLEFSADATRQIGRAARKRRTPLNSVLHAAMLLSLARAKYAGQTLPMRGLTFADIRPYLRPPPPSDRLGVYISMMPYTVPVSPDTRLWPLAQAVSDQIYAATKSSDKFAAALSARDLVRFLGWRKTMRMGHVALSYPGPIPIEAAYGATRVTGMTGAVANNPLGPELAGFGKLLHGRLSLDLQYLESDMDADTATAVLEDIQTILGQEELTHHEDSNRPDPETG